MIDIWVKYISDQFELSLKLTRALFGLGGMEAPVPGHTGIEASVVPDEACAPAENPMIEPQEAGLEEDRVSSRIGSVRDEAVPIPDIISFLESSNRGATVREIAEHLEMDKKSILPLLKKLVKEGRIDELLGRYCALKN